MKAKISCGSATKKREPFIEVTPLDNSPQKMDDQMKAARDKVNVKMSIQQKAMKELEKIVVLKERTEELLEKRREILGY